MVPIVPPDYRRWINPAEADPREVMKPFPYELMTIWPISTQVNSPANDAPGLLDRHIDSIKSKG